jgi:erythromycin esterase-like protein
MTHRHRSMEAVLRNDARMLDEQPHDYDALLAMAGERPFVLLGEATHGTREFYRMRAQITQRLIDEAGFDAVVVEGDWPDVYRINRYVQGLGEDTLDQAFEDFRRFPTWMWRNREVRDFVQWLRARNAGLPSVQRVGFYGMDLYSLYRSADEVIGYLETVDAEQAEAARRLYVCLDHVRDPQQYGYAAATGLRPSCREAAANLLVDLVRKAPGYLKGDTRTDGDRQFLAERNAHVVMRAEQYYREMFGRRTRSWNLRDSHMADTVLDLHRHLREQGRPGRIVVWAHNSHLGDARATQMGRTGEWNVGQLLRQQVGADRVLLVGFTTYTGHVTAARDWDQPPERRWVRPAQRDSWEHAFHASGKDRFFLPLRDGSQVLEGAMLERAIGVVYRPESEMASHYFDAVLGEQFDAVFHLDETTALEPLDVGVHWMRHEPPDTYPTGL